MIAVNEEQLADLFATAIDAIVPRIQYQGSEAWKRYDRAVAAPSRTRNYRIVFTTQPRLFEQGTRAGDVFEHEIEMTIRTDYAGAHPKTQFAAADDFLQLRDVLSALKATDQGVRLVTPTRSVPAPAGADGTASTDTTQIDHVYTVRYMRSIRP